MRNTQGPAPFVVMLVVAAAAPVQGAEAPPLVQAVDAIGMTVSDMDTALAFYRDVLTFEPVSDIEVHGSEYERLAGLFGLRMRVVRLRLGQETITLTDYLVPEGRPIPADSRSHDRWFQHIAIVVSDMPRAYQRLRAAKVAHASTGPQRLPDWNPHAGGIEAFYFKDPDGHVLEIIHFPPGKGAARWQLPAERLFVGIDHTAMVVADTEASLRFYREALGLQVAGGSENYGPEQEHLNQVFGARLRITTLRAAQGPGIELLEYLAPRDGRPAPADTRPNDLWAWQTQVTVQDATAAEAATRQAHVPWRSPGVVTLPQQELGVTRGLVVADPDGHALALLQPS